MKPTVLNGTTNTPRKVLAAFVAATLFLAACGAEPATVPTATPYGATPTASSDVATATANPAGTATAQAARATGEAAQSTKAPGAANANTAADAARQYAALPPEQRLNILQAPPPLSIDVTRKYVVTINLAKGGAIKLELDPGVAPKTVNNFVYLAENGFYDGTVFHRVIADFMAQGGDPTGTGTGGPGYQFEDEPNNQVFDKAGIIAMANSGPNTNGSQFFITFAPTPHLNGRHTIFGKVVDGMDALMKITLREPGAPTPGDVIGRVDVQKTDAATQPEPTIAPTATPVPEPAACAPYALNLQANDQVYGNKDALVTMVEYGDMQCPACAAAHPGIKTSMAVLSDSVRLVFRHFPLVEAHDKAIISARGTEAAAVQGKFWEMHDVLYEKQADWSKLAYAEITNTLKTYAQGLGLDVAKFEADLGSAAVAAKVDANTASGKKLGVQGTPSIYLDGRPINPQAFTAPDVITQFKQYAERRIADAVGKPKDFNFAPPENTVEAGATYQITIKTTKGDIVADVNPKLAPVNVNAILFLAGKNYFAGAPVAFNDPNDPSAGAALFDAPTSSRNPGFDCSVEKPASAAITGTAGTLALFGDETRSFAQFIVVYTDTQLLGGRYTVIGNVTSGLDIAKSLQVASPPAATGTTTTTVTTKADSIVAVEVKKK